MAASPRWKVHDSRGRYQAACKEIEAAACLMGFYGLGATIRCSGWGIVWCEGREGYAMDSYDRVVEVVNSHVEGKSCREQIR